MTTANNVSKATTRPVIDREGRESYAYILNVNGTPTKTLARGWWSTREGMMLQKAAMATAARAFKKTACWFIGCTMMGRFISATRARRRAGT